MFPGLGLGLGRVGVRCCLVCVLTVVFFLPLSLCSQLQLCISNSSWSDAFSLDTVGSYGCVQCPANNMDYLVTAQRLNKLSFEDNSTHNDTLQVLYPTLKCSAK